MTLIKSKVIKQKTKKCRIYKENGQCVEGSNPPLATKKHRLTGGVFHIHGEIQLRISAIF